MPFTLRKVNRRNCYKVFNVKSKRVHAKCTSKAKAKKQLQLLRAITYNKKFVLTPRNNRTRKNSKK
jgi:hypothetical protein